MSSEVDRLDRSLNVGIFVFPDAEVLDFAGPYEVYSVASRVAERDHDAPVNSFNVCLISKDGLLVNARHGFKVVPDFSFATCPALDILVVAGGVMNEPLANPEVRDWIVKCHGQVNLTTSVCTGSLLLASAGILDGLIATTHWEDLEELKMYPNVEVLGDVEMVDQGTIITSAGVSSGIVMSLNIVGDILGEDAARRTARQMEYPFEYSQRGNRPGGQHEFQQDWRYGLRTKTKAFQAQSPDA